MIDNSILRYEDRGSWGNSKYRGNVTGYLIKDLLDRYQPKQFVEVFSGGGTGRDVAKSMGIANSIHLDLNNGWNALKDDIPTTSDFVFSHPPYWDIIKYETMRGSYDPDDLSNVMSYDEFITKLDRVNLKIYNSLTNGGHHAFLMGDIRKRIDGNYKYYSVIKDMTWFGDLESYLIKEQVNVTSNRRKYNGNFIPIMHEHLLIFVKHSIWALPLKYTKDYLTDIRQLKTITWRELVRAALQILGGTAKLKDLYQELSGARKAEANSHWQEKIRQVVQTYPEFNRVDQGIYQVTSA